MAMHPVITYQVKGTQIRETDKAKLITIKTIDDVEILPLKSYWISKSQITAEFPSEFPGEDDAFSIKEWILNQHNLLKDIK